MINQKKAAIVMQTDFTKDISVCTMQGVCMSIDPELKIFDSTHDIKSFNTYMASTSLSYVVPFWPKGTVFVSVVDPGVGTNRKACVAKLKNGSFIVTPDNGTLTHVNLYIGIDEVRIIDETQHRLQSTLKCNIFHGRDLFAYCAAKLASGIISFEEIGPKYALNEIILHKILEPIKIENKITGMIDTADFHFGLVCSNISFELFETLNPKFGDTFNLLIKNSETSKIVFNENLTFQESFGAVKIGEPLLMISETLQVQSAINNRNMTSIYGIDCGPNWIFEITKL